MNLPNKLTMSRLVLVPVFMAVMLEGYYLPALAIFCVAAITDFFDGYLARKKNLVSSFGKIMDPLADKLLVFSALVCFVQMGVISVWAPIIIIAREFFVTSMRVVAVSKGKVIAASWWGKIKTIFQMVAIIVAILLFLPIFPENISVMVTDILVWISAVITVVSGYDYVAKNFDLIKEAK